MSDAGIELVAFVGLGAMGGPMCANLSRKSPVPTLAYDLDPNAVQAAVSSGSVAANDLADASRADVVFICVPGEEQIRAVCLAEGGLCDHAKAGQIVVDCTTATVRVNLDVSEALATKGAHFADAPVARGVPNAHDGTLSITVGASEEIFNRIAPWLSYMGTDVAYCGPVGTGTVMKLMNNMVLFENVSALTQEITSRRNAAA